jgi:hypothetical protein
MKYLALVISFSFFLNSCIEIEEQTVTLNQKNKTGVILFQNITSDDVGEDAIDDFSSFMQSFDSGKVLDEFFLGDADRGIRILKKKMYKRNGNLHAKIEFSYASLELLGFNTCYFEDSIAQKVVLNEMMQDRVYYHIPQEYSHGYFTNALVSNSFINVFESDNDFEAHSKEDLLTKSLVFSWEEHQEIRYTRYSNVDDANTSMLAYWKDNK